MLKYLVEKEFRQFLRNRFLLRMVLGFPVVWLLVLPLAANFEVKNINLALVDSDHSSLSSRLVRKVESSGNFRITCVAQDLEGALAAVELDRSDIVLEIPEGFERDLVRDRASRVMISANSVNAVKGSIGSAYLSGIVSAFSAEVRESLLVPRANPGVPSFLIIPQYRYNPHLRYTVFMVPALMVMILAMLCGFLPAMNIVMEKERGTIEQMNVTPVRRFTLIFAKLVPYWVMGFIVLTVCFGVARVAYGLSSAGSLATVYLFAAVFILAMSGLGLVISNYAQTVQQAMFMIFFFVITMILISGLYTPVSSMPRWVRVLSGFSPLRYIIDVIRMVYLKGSGIRDLWRQFLALCAFAFFFNGWAIIGYRKTN